MTSHPIHISITDVTPAPASPPVTDARLGAALEFLRGGTMADVGTDHAYLPIAALTKGLSSFAVATDIHKGPAEIAAFHLAENGIGNDRVAVLLTDGLHGAEPYHPTDVCIFGMGGEMIARIIDEAPWVKDASVRLILQPMTKQSALREYLDRNGFCVVAERLVETDRIFQILCAEYDGTPRAHTPLELLMGKENLDRRDGIARKLALRQMDILSAAREGKRQGASPDTSREDALLASLNEYLEQTTEV